jgi:hypothetical protein
MLNVDVQGVRVLGATLWSEGDEEMKQTVGMSLSSQLRVHTDRVYFLLCFRAEMSLTDYRV